MGSENEKDRLTIGVDSRVARSPRKDAVNIFFSSPTTEKSMWISGLKEGVLSNEAGSALIAGSKTPLATMIASATRHLSAKMRCRDIDELQQTKVSSGWCVWRNVGDSP